MGFDAPHLAHRFFVSSLLTTIASTFHSALLGLQDSPKARSQPLSVLLRENRLPRLDSLQARLQHTPLRWLCGPAPGHVNTDFQDLDEPDDAESVLVPRTASVHPRKRTDGNLLHI